MEFGLKENIYFITLTILNTIKDCQTFSTLTLSQKNFKEY